MIYLDYNATTPLCQAARDAMLPYLDKFFGNASSIHQAGRDARAAVDDARDKIAGLLRVKPHEIIFTSGATESCNLGLFGLARGRASKHLISVKTEHHGVSHAVEHLEKHEGFEVSWLNVAENGLVDLDHLAESIREDTALVSIMSANNETGVLQPIEEIAQICRAKGVPFHSDMVQSFAKIETDCSLVDAASFCAHKFYGPKGTGFLYLRSGVPIQPIMYGGSHENERRPGTENVPGIAGMAAAAEWALSNRTAEQDRQRKLRDDLFRRIAEAFPDICLNGESAPRLANTLNVSFVGLDSETMLIALDLKSICASSGSACMVGSVRASHVILAMGLPTERARSAVRFSLGKPTTAAEIAIAGDAIREVIHRLQTRQAENYVVA